MEDDSKVPVLVRTLDRLKACAEGRQTRVCLTSKECERVCVYVWWLTDRLAEARGMTEEGDEPTRNGA